MELVTTFVLVWFGVAAALNLVAERVLNPAFRSRPLWRNSTGFLALSVGFLTAWILYQSFLQSDVMAEYDRTFEARRAAARNCDARYSQARTRRDSVTVDTIHPVADVQDPNGFLTCGLLRKSGKLECAPGSPC